MEIHHSGCYTQVYGADIDLCRTFECGQCFRFEEHGGVYTGIAYGRKLRVWKELGALCISSDKSEFESLWRGYFDLDRDYTKIAFCAGENDFLKRCAAFGRGIRILRQEPWEALCSFILSQCNHIPRIKGIVARLCETFGEPVEGGFAFPSPERIAELRCEDLAGLRAGYRADYVLQAARAVAGGRIDLCALRDMPADAAREKLMELAGVGGKVADCVLLFGLSHLNAFPVDTWIKKALRQHELPDLSRFGEYAGVWQQYIFYYMRENARTG